MMLRNMARAALMASVTAVLSWIAVDLPWARPSHGADARVMLSGLLPEPREAALSQVVSCWRAPWACRCSQGAGLEQG